MRLFYQVKCCQIPKQIRAKAIPGEPFFQFCADTPVLEGQIKKVDCLAIADEDAVIFSTPFDIFFHLYIICIRSCSSILWNFIGLFFKKIRFILQTKVWSAVFGE